MDNEISDDILNCMQNWLDESSAKQSSNIEKVLGKLPAWVPEIVNIRLKQIIKKYLSEGVPVELLQQFATEADIDKVFVPGTIQDSIGFLQDMNFLSHVRYALELGKMEGVKVLAGELAAKGAGFSEGGRTKKGKVYEPAASIKIICESIGSYRFDDVLAVLQDADRCADMYESTNKPTGVLFSDVDCNAKTFSFTKRGDNPDNQKKRTFGRLENILSGLKK